MSFNASIALHKRYIIFCISIKKVQEQSGVQDQEHDVRKPRGQTDDRRVRRVDHGHVHVPSDERGGHRADVVQAQRAGRAQDRGARVGVVANDPGAQPVEGQGHLQGLPEAHGVVAEERRAAEDRGQARERVRRRRRLVHYDSHLLGREGGHRGVHGDRVQHRRHGHVQSEPQSDR